jgi:hypothetical protein
VTVERSMIEVPVIVVWDPVEVNTEVVMFLPLKRADAAGSKPPEPDTEGEDIGVAGGEERTDCKSLAEPPADEPEAVGDAIEVVRVVGRVVMGGTVRTPRSLIEIVFALAGSVIVRTATALVPSSIITSMTLLVTVACGDRALCRSESRRSESRLCRRGRWGVERRPWTFRGTTESTLRLRSSESSTEASNMVCLTSLSSGYVVLMGDPLSSSFDFDSVKVWVNCVTILDSFCRFDGYSMDVKGATEKSLISGNDGIGVRKGVAVPRSAA